MIYDVLIAGSGLSSMAFLTSYATKNKKVHVISPIRNNNLKSNKNIHITKNLPPQYLKKKNEIDNYFHWNDLVINKTSYLIGSLGFGGLSNNWGYQIENNFDTDISHFSTRNKKLIKTSFNVFFNKTEKYKESKNNIFKELLKIKLKNFFFKKVKIARFNPDTNFKSLENDKMNASNFYNYYLKNKKIIFLDYVIKNIKKNKKLIELNVVDKNNNNKKIYTKKLVLGTGTIVTTKLISEYLKINRKIRIKHHPRFILSFLTRKPIFLKKEIESEIKAFAFNNREFVVDFRSNAISIMDTIKKSFNNVGVSFFLNILKKKLIFSNVFISSKYSSLYMKKNNEQTLVFSEVDSVKINKINKIKEIVLELKNELIKNKLIYPFFKTFVPDAGADYHYFGSIKINNKKFGVNDKFQLNANKNIYIIDGSCMDYKNTFYPMGVTMANARRIGFLVK